jgi:hypothetical protein
MVSRIGRAAALAATALAIVACDGAPKEVNDEVRQQQPPPAAGPDEGSGASASVIATRSGVSAGSNRASSKRFTLTSTTGQASAVRFGDGQAQPLELDVREQRGAR